MIPGHYPLLFLTYLSEHTFLKSRAFSLKKHFELIKTFPSFSMVVSNWKEFGKEFELPIFSKKTIFGIRIVLPTYKRAFVESISLKK